MKTRQTARPTIQDHSESEKEQVEEENESSIVENSEDQEQVQEDESDSEDWEKALAEEKYQSRGSGTRCPPTTCIGGLKGLEIRGE